MASCRVRRDAGRLVLLRCVIMNPFWADAGVRARLIPELIAALRRMITGTDVSTVPGKT